MIATNIEQSRRLLELGLSPDSADMFYPTDGSSIPEVCDNGDNMQADTPAWSLSALLEVMPKELEVGLFKTPISGEYFFSWWTNDHHMGDDCKEPIDAAYKMVCYLLRNNLITNN